MASPKEVVPAPPAFITYRIGKGGHYREGTLYNEGDTITVESLEVPGPNWVDVAIDAAEAAAVVATNAAAVNAAKEASKRPGDKAI